MSIIIIIIIIIIAIILAVFIAGIITNPIKKIVNRMLQIVDGNLQFPNLTTVTKDETAQLVHATNTMNDKLKNVITSIIEASDNVRSQSRNLSTSAMK